MGGRKKKAGTARSKLKRRPKGNYQSVDSGEDQPACPNPQRKRRNAQNKKNNNNNTDDAQLRASLALDGMEIVEMSADGNCIFRSLSDQLFGDFGNAHEHVRLAIVDHMKANADNYRHFLVYEDEDDEDQTEEDAKDFPHYLETMRQDGEWGGNLELVAAAGLYGRKIIVYQASMAPAFTIDHDGGSTKSTGPDLLVSYHDNYHYNSVRCSNNPPRSSKQGLAVTLTSSAATEDNIPIPERSRRDCEGDADDDDDVDNNPTSTSVASDLDDDVDKIVTRSMSTLDVADRTNKHTSIGSSSISTSSSLSNSKPKAKSRNDVKKNDACPCGSGMRYKKCCLAKFKHAARLKQRGGGVANDDDEGGEDDEVASRTSSTTRGGRLQVIQI